MRILPFIFGLIIFLCPVSSLAQTAPDNSLLPEINPQDIEIRSEFKARFPGLRRQPILGFNPKPRVFQIQANRMPFMESRDDAVANISVTQLGRPEPPQRSPLSIPDRMNGYLRGAFGSYLTGDLKGYGYYALNEKSVLTANVDLRASDGHLDYQESGFRYFDLDASYYNRINEDTKVTIDIGALSDYNALYNLSDNLQQNFIGETAVKNYSGFSGQIRVQKNKNTLHGWELAAGGNVFNTSMDAGTSGLGGELDEQQVHTSYNYYWPGSNMYETYTINASLEAGNYSPANLSKQNWVDASASVELERLLNFTTRITGKLGVEYLSDPASSSIYLAPELAVKHNLSKNIALTGTVYGRPYLKNQQDHHQYNRFLSISSTLRKSYEMGARGEVDFQVLEGNRVYGGIQYKVTDNYAYYQRNTVALTGEPGFYSVAYEKASLFELYAGASQQLVPDTFWADAKVYLRSPKLDTGGTIPYEEKLGLEAALSYKPIKALTINGWAEYIGKRESPETGNDLNAFLLLNAGGEYQINETFGVYAKLLNILGQEYELWNGYTERPFQIFGGITIKF